MPTYLHGCTNEECNNEWEDFYSVSADPPTVCPKCNQETATRLINNSTKGVVALYGNDLVQKIKGDAAQIQKNAANNENLYANLLSETKYQQLQTSMDKAKREKY